MMIRREHQGRSGERKRKKSVKEGEGGGEKSDDGSQLGVII